ncbi:putative protease [Aquitalea magnusonii]|jgi:collagenase-like PrtC family protease|uniref:Ubiquinone biosynthesis protein UbiV n=1 Tax=Aquitalea magnusonii TaxID=332411 RepID=A0A3G9GGN0_9NEIS|nr:U32 family peptidase [Aquitalea magnusonii]BBF87020.1 putative protease [Aquitalea magnusonii]
MKTLQLTLGPVLFYWSRDDILRFYSEAADWPLETIYLGEAVCSRRQQLRGQDWISLGQELAQSGRQVVLSSQALIESESDLRRLRKLVENGTLQLEANDLGAARLARQQGQAFVAGHHLNIYNADTLALLQSLGARRWIPPVEMDRDTLSAVLAQASANGVHIETELFAWGRLPLALSARCFTARHYNLSKDDCQFRCMEHPDGLRLNTREQQAFLTINGIQTMSDGCHSLLPHLPDICAMGINALRISPQWQHTAQIVLGYRQAIDAIASRNAAEVDLSPYSDSLLVDGYWRGTAGIAAIGETRHAHS